MKTLGAAFFVADGIRFDYPFVQAIKSLKPICDEIAIIFFSENELKLLNEAYDYRPPSKLKISIRTKEEWESMYSGRISYWSAQARDMLTTDWYIILDADEVIHENSYPAIKKAIQKEADGYYVKRINLWRDPYHTFNLPGNKQPCGDKVVRIAKRQYRCGRDTETIIVPYPSDEFFEEIRIYHMGFVRDRRVMNAKTKNHQGNIYQIAVDPNVEKDEKENDGIFRPETRYPDDVLIPISEPLPALIQDWAKTRAYGYENPFEKKP